MSSLEDALWFTVTWVAEPTACPRCQALNGQQWLVATIEQVIGIKDTHTHPHCKCTVDVQIDVDTEKLQIEG